MYSKLFILVCGTLEFWCIWHHATLCSLYRQTFLTQLPSRQEVSLAFHELQAVSLGHVEGLFSQVHTLHIGPLSSVGEEPTQTVLSSVFFSGSPPCQPSTLSSPACTISAQEASTKLASSFVSLPIPRASFQRVGGSVTGFISLLSRNHWPRLHEALSRKAIGPSVPVFLPAFSVVSCRWMHAVTAPWVSKLLLSMKHCYAFWMNCPVLKHSSLWLLTVFTRLPTNSPTQAFL